MSADPGRICTAVRPNPIHAACVPSWGEAMVTPTPTRSSPPSSCTYQRRMMPPRLWPMTCTCCVPVAALINSTRARSCAARAATLWRNGL